LDGERDDRRVRRTRRLLRGALLELILEKGYDHVTVQDVLDRADVGRATFYAHFHDKDDLLVSGLEELRESLRQQMAAFVRARGHRSDDGIDLTRILFDHAAGHRRLYRALVGKRGGGVILRRAHEELAALLREHVEDVVAQRGLQPVVPPEVLVQYLVSALLGVFTWWLDNQVPYTPEEMSRTFQHISHSVFAVALGTSPTSHTSPV
jgi:AcrR family transcriptional regulator